MRLPTYIALLVLLSACTDGLNRDSAPDDLIQKDKMTLVVIDLVKHEAFIQQKYQRVDRFYPVMTRTGDSIMKAHDISRDQFTRSMDYYSVRQEEMQEIYGEALNQLNKELGEVQSR